MLFISIKLTLKLEFANDFFIKFAEYLLLRVLPLDTFQVVWIALQDVGLALQVVWTAMQVVLLSLQVSIFSHDCSIVFSNV